MTIDYVAWMGIATWTCGPTIPRRSRGLSMAPGDTPDRITVETAGGCVPAFEDIEREYTHIQWLLSRAPLDEAVVSYRHKQDLRVTEDALTDPTFAVVDFSGRDYGPEASLATARSARTMLDAHIPEWDLAEPLGLLALAVREHLTGETVREMTAEYACRLDGPGATLAYGRLAYSVASNPGESGPPEITLHVADGDPIFTPPVLEHLIDRARDFAAVFGSSIDCRGTFRDIVRHPDFPATVHEADALGLPIPLFRIPLAAELLPAAALERAPSSCTGIRTTAPSGRGPSRRAGASSIAASCSEAPEAGGRHRRPAARVRGQRSRLPRGASAFLRDLGIAGHVGDSRVAPGRRHPLARCFTTCATSSTTSGCTRTWTSPSRSSGASRHASPMAPGCRACGRGPWGARKLAAADAALAVAVVRHAVDGTIPPGVSWIGVRHSRPAPAHHHITVAVLGDGGTGLADAIGAACATLLPGADVTCEVVDAAGLDDTGGWVTAAGRHPRFRLLPAAMQLERLNEI